MSKLEHVHIPRVADLPDEAHLEKINLQSQDIKSLIVVPMVLGGTLIGFAGFDAVRDERTWSEEFVSLLKITGDIFVSALERKRTDVALQESEKRFRSIVDSCFEGMMEWLSLNQIVNAFVNVFARGTFSSFDVSMLLAYNDCKTEKRRRGGGMGRRKGLKIQKED